MPCREVHDGAVVLCKAPLPLAVLRVWYLLTNPKSDAMVPIRACSRMQHPVVSVRQHLGTDQSCLLNATQQHLHMSELAFEDISFGRNLESFHARIFAWGTWIKQSEHVKRDERELVPHALLGCAWASCPVLGHV